MEINDTTELVLECAYKVHTALGPGLLESAYEACLKHELIKSGLAVRSQVALPIFYDGVSVEVGYLIDLLIENKVVIELKSVAKLLPIHEAQLLSYLKLSGYQVGLLMNFNVPRLKQGIKRMVNNL